MSRIISTEDDIAEGLAVLTAADPRLAPLAKASGTLPLRRSQGGLPGLLRIVVSQQVSVASASAIWARVEAIFAPLTAETILAAEEAAFRRAGLSGPKIRTMRAVAEAVAGGFDLVALRDLETDEAHRRLTALKGIGPWTADVYALFCLGQADAFAAGDLALQEAARLGLELAARPSAAELLAIAEAWQPWRGVAARLLWAYYRVAKAGRDGTPLLATTSAGTP
jgi:DNA-3-methyladenine glycosylase II